MLKQNSIFKFSEAELGHTKAMTYPTLRETLDTEARGIATFIGNYLDSYPDGVVALISAPPRKSAFRKRKKVVFRPGRGKRQRAGSGSESGSRSASEDDDDYVKAIRVDDDDDASGPSEDGKEAAL